MKLRNSLVAAALLWVGAVLAAGVDPLTVQLDATDAIRFARLMTDGAVPTAEVLQREYLDNAGPGVKVFTPLRIVDAQHLAKVVAAHPDSYRYAIQNCLPRLPSLQADLRAVYLAYAGLLPEKPLPAIQVIFGALNSGGTASPDAQSLASKSPAHPARPSSSSGRRCAASSLTRPCIRGRKTRRRRRLQTPC